MALLHLGSLIHLSSNLARSTIDFHSPIRPFVLPCTVIALICSDALSQVRTANVLGCEDTKLLVGTYLPFQDLEV